MRRHSCRRRCLLLALLFSLAVGPLFSVLFTRCCDHASRRSGFQFLCSGFLSQDHPLFHLGHVFRVCCLHASIRRRRCCCGLPDVVVCVCLLACHALRDVIMAFHELLRTVRLITACSLTCCAWSAGLTSCSSVRVQHVEVTDALRIFVHVAVLLRSAFGEGLSHPMGSPEYGCERASCGSLRPLGAHPAKTESFQLLSRALQLRSCSPAAAPAATVMCLMVSGQFSTQTCLY